MKALSLFLFCLVSFTCNAAPTPVSILSYNVWGVPFAGKKSRKRIPEIGQRLAPQSIDIVTIQESFEGCFVFNESKVLMKNSGYPYVAQGPGPRGLKCASSGLLILSKFPIVESDTVVFDQCTGADCFARKGVLYARVSVPGVGDVDVYTTHTNSGNRPQDAEVRVTQMEQIIEFVERHSGHQSRPVLLTGDLNAEPRSDEMNRLQSVLSLRDTQDEFVNSGGVSNVDRDGFTSDPQRNGNYQLPTSQRSRRIDYVLMRTSRTQQSTDLRAIKTELAFVEPGYAGRALSDHFGVHALVGLDTHELRISQVQQPNRTW